MRNVVLTLALLLATATTIAGENWPQFRGPTGDGHTGVTGLPLTWSETENVTWKTAVHGRGWSSPVVWGDQIWLTTATEDGKQLSAVCVDLATGKTVHDLPLFDVAEPGEIHALNSHASPTPAIEAGRVYIHFGTYGTACLDTATGKPIWIRRDLLCDHFRGPGSSVFLYEGMVILHYDGIDVQFLVALDKTTGETVWKTNRSTEFGNIEGDLRKAYSTPIVIRAGGRTQLISPGAKAAMAYDPTTGKELWKICYGGFSNVSRPLFGHGLVFINTGFGSPQLWAVRPDGHGDVTDTHVVWKLRRGVPAKPTPLLIDDLLYMVDDKGVASCVEAKTGEIVWQERIGGQFSASPIYSEGRIYCFGHEPNAPVLAVGREFKILAENELDAGFMASPAIVSKAMILRTKTHLYRIER